MLPLLNNLERQYTFFPLLILFLSFFLESTPIRNFSQNDIELGHVHSTLVISKFSGNFLALDLVDHSFSLHDVTPCHILLKNI